MCELNPNALYKKGVCKNLDKQLREYRKLRIWKGTATNYALTEKEADIMAQLWFKERQTPWKLTNHEVSSLTVGFL